MKKIIQLALLLAILMPAAATAYDFEVDGIYYNRSGQNAIVTYKGYNGNDYYNDYSGDLVIPDSVTWGDKTYPVTSIANYAYNKTTGLTSVTLPSTVTKIDNYAFYGCTEIIEINLPDNLSTIGKYAFAQCSGLTSITIPQGVTSIADHAFSPCENVKILNFNAIACNNFSGAYSTPFEFKYFEEINIGEGVQRIPDYFAYNSMTITSLDIPNSVTYIGTFAFYYSINLVTHLHISSAVTHIGLNALHGCMYLTGISVDENNPVYDSRDNCNAIIETATNTLINGCTYTVIPNTVTAIAESAFMQNIDSNHTPLVVPNSVTSIGYRAFAYTSNFKGIHIGSGVTSIGAEAFAGCKDMVTITVDENNPVYDSRDSCNAIIETATNTLVVGSKKTIIPNTVTAIGDYAFNRYAISSITIPNSVTTIGDYAFQYCGLSELNMGNSVTHVGIEAFYDSRIANLIIPKSITYMGRHAFSSYSVYDVYCYIPDPSLVTTGSQVFRPSSDMYFHRLHVPAGSLEAYQNDDNWNWLFGEIVEMDPTGDANGDGTFSISDVTTIIDYLLGGISLPSINRINADINCSGDLTIGDLTALIDKLLSNGF